MNIDIIKLLEELYELLRKGLSLEKALNELQNRPGITAEIIEKLKREYEKRKNLKQKIYDPEFVEALNDLAKTISSDNSLGL